MVNYFVIKNNCKCHHLECIGIKVHNSFLDDKKLKTASVICMC